MHWHRRRIGSWPPGSRSCCTAISRSSSRRWGACPTTPRCRSPSRRAGGHGMYSVLGLPPQALAPVLDALAAETRAFGVNFFPGVMDAARSSSPPSARPTSTSSSPTPTLRSSRSCTRAAASAAGRSSPARRRARRRRPAATSSSPRAGSPAGASASRGRRCCRCSTRARRRRRAGRRRRRDRDRARGRRRLRGRRRGSPRRDALHRGGGVRGASRVGARRSLDARAASGRQPRVQRRHARAGAAPRAAQLGRRRRGADRRPGGRDADRRGGDRGPRFGPQPPSRDATGAVRAMAFYAGQSAGAVHAIQPAGEIVAELAAGVPG